MFLIVDSKLFPKKSFEIKVSEFDTILENRHALSDRRKTITIRTTVGLINLLTLHMNGRVPSLWMRNIRILTSMLVSFATMWGTYIIATMWGTFISATMWVKMSRCAANGALQIVAELHKALREERVSDDPGSENHVVIRSCLGLVDDHVRWDVV